MSTAPTPEISPDPMLTPAPAARTRICPECSKPFSPPVKGPGQHKRFCRTECRMAWGAREKAEGGVLVTVAKIWRLARGSGDTGKAAFAELCSILDLLNDNDRKEGRQPLRADGPVGPFVKAILAERYIDRRR